VTAERRAGGFTLIEVLIAIVVLGIGILGVLALHTATVTVSSTATNEAFVSNLARSVDAAVHEGATQRAFVLQEGTSLVRGFILRHDGVARGSPPTLPPHGIFVDDATWPPYQQALPQLASADDVIFLPTAPASATVPEPTFVYPRPTGAAAENPSVAGTTLKPGRDDWLTTGVPGHDGLVYLDVERTYALPYQNPPPQPVEASRLFSFAIVIRRAAAPTLGAPPAPIDSFQFAPGDPGPGSYPTTGARADGLYEVQILVYRAFDPAPLSANHTEVARFVSLLALGP
jgi:prepilin-type N-terminal cleavage/methylation domain-containing protein